MSALIFAAMRFAKRHARVAVKHRAGGGAGKSDVNFRYTRAFNNARGVALSNTATSHDDDSSFRGFHETRNGVGSL